MTNEDMTIKENRLASYYREQLVILRMDTYEEPREIAQAWVDALDKKDVLDLIEEFDMVGIVDLDQISVIENWFHREQLII
jgi:hypothetical protein